MFTTRAPEFQTTGASRLVVVPEWPRLPPDIRLYRVSMVVVGKTGTVYVVHRGASPVLCLNPDGTLRQVIGEHHFSKATGYDVSGPVPEPMEDLFCLHGLHLDPWENIWVTEFSRHIAMRFNPAGVLTMTLGTAGQSGCDSTHFYQPTHVWVVPSGDIFVADGYGNSRVAKFTPDGQFVRAWGSRGTGPGQFHTPHVIAPASHGRLCISDRENDRIQIFDQDGGLMDTWSGLHSVDGLCRAPDGSLYGSAGLDNAIIRFDGEGRPAEVWAEKGLLDYPHGVWVDRDDSIYVAETSASEKGSRLLKLRRA